MPFLQLKNRFRRQGSHAIAFPTRSSESFERGFARQAGPQTSGSRRSIPRAATHAGDASTAPKTDTLTLQPPKMKEVSAGGSGSAWCAGPCTRNLTITLEGKAPAEGLPLTLASSRPSLISIPATATVPAGSDKLSVAFDAGQVGSNTKVTLSASYGGHAKKE